ncbi:MAG TPA: hypothetical protein VKG26_01215 [Bacteroidia bacterium]|nr:hypothetical protein [Bacteroidia bacterium]
MKTNKLFVRYSLFCCMLSFMACSNSNKENPNKNLTIGVNDSTPQSSRDSIAKGTTVTPSPSAIPAE